MTRRPVVNRPWTMVMATVVAVSLEAASPAQAQQAEAPPMPLPRWEVGASVGGFFMSREAIDQALPAERGPAVPDLDFERFTVDDWAATSFGADLAYYWTPHLKFEGSYLERTSLETQDDEAVPLAIAPQAWFFVFTPQTLRLSTVSLAVAFQFRENVFLHPYVSAGARLGWFRQHRVREDQNVETPYPVTIVGVDEHNRRAQLRPFVAGGLKSYFGRYAFMRPEAAVAFGPGGAPDFSFRVVFGRDF